MASDVGKGTVFTIELPFEPVPQGSPKPRKLRNLLHKGSRSPKVMTDPNSQHADNDNESTGGLKVLVAEANPATLRMLDERLSQWGHHVDIASDGQECHGQFVADPSKVDVIIMDIEVCISLSIVVLHAWY